MGLQGHLRGFSFPSEDHGSRGLGLAAGSQKAQGFKACRVIQLWGRSYNFNQMETSHHSPDSHAAERSWSGPLLCWQSLPASSSPLQPCLSPCTSRRRSTSFGGPSGTHQSYRLMQTILSETGNLLAEPCLLEGDLLGNISKPGAQTTLECGLNQNLGNGQLQQEDGWREKYSRGVRSLSASGHSNSSSLQHLLTTQAASISFPTPPPPPDWLSRWGGDWWLVPAGMMTCCSSCRVWGPLTP